MRKMNTWHFGGLVLRAVFLSAISVNGQEIPPQSPVNHGRVSLTLPNVNPFKEMLPADFCDVIENASRYDGKIIRVRGILWQTFEGSVLLASDHSPSCDGMRVVLDCTGDE